MSPTGYPDYPTSLLQAPRFTVLNPPPSGTRRKGSDGSELMKQKGLPFTMRETTRQAWLLLVILLSVPLVGCLGSEGEPENENPITMNVHYDATAGMIEQRIQNGATISTTGVELSFDFARVTSKAGVMKSFTYDPGDDDDGSNSMTVNANDQAEITYTYLTHGLFTAVLTAVDESDNARSMEVHIRIDKETIWTQTNTDAPSNMPVSTMPDCECAAPEKISLDSTITNGGGFVGAQVTVSWHLINPDSVEEAAHTEQIGNGQNASWSHSEYNIAKGDWSLEVTIDAGNDSIDISHRVMVLYAEEESLPNPLEAPVSNEQEISLSQKEN